MQNIAIIGTGQQGASIARSLAQSNNYKITTYDNCPIACAEFTSLIEKTPEIEVKNDLLSAIHGANIIVLATPIDSFTPILQEIKDHLNENTIITDIGSSKTKSIQEIKQHLPMTIPYVPAHPIIGKARCGPMASDAQMYQKENIIIVPNQDHPQNFAYNEVHKMWHSMGGNIVQMSAESHDLLYGTISHFEHIAMFALTRISAHLYKTNLSSQYLLNATRIAEGASPEMWVPIFNDNHDYILQTARRYKKHLSTMKSVLKYEEHKTLHQLLEQAHKFRSKIQDEKERLSLPEEIHHLFQNCHIQNTSTSELEKITSNFSSDDKRLLVDSLLMPGIVSIALTLNAKDVTEKYLHNIEISKLANPSFKDGSAFSLITPKLANPLILHHRLDIIMKLKSFEKELDKLMIAIESADDEFVYTYITKASEIRIGTRKNS